MLIKMGGIAQNNTKITKITTINNTQKDIDGIILSALL